VHSAYPPVFTRRRVFSLARSQLVGMGSFAPFELFASLFPPGANDRWLQDGASPPLFQTPPFSRIPTFPGVVQPSAPSFKLPPFPCVSSGVTAPQSLPLFSPRNRNPLCVDGLVLLNPFPASDMNFHPSRGFFFSQSLLKEEPALLKVKKFQENTCIGVPQAPRSLIVLSSPPPRWGTLRTPFTAPPFLFPLGVVPATLYLRPPLPTTKSRGMLTVLYALFRFPLPPLPLTWLPAPRRSPPLPPTGGCPAVSSGPSRSSVTLDLLAC